MEINLPLTKLLVEGNLCYYAILNKNGDIRFANRLFPQTIANVETVVENTSFFNVVKADHKTVAEQFLSKSGLKNNKVEVVELNHPTLNGQLVHIEWNATAREVNNEREIHLLGVEKLKAVAAENVSSTATGKSSEKISELKTLNAALAKRAAELASSNEELERFAYVASHDLQEPLRMVSSFLQLLQKRYKDKLDSKANEYIHFAVDGAERMKTLILDLLKFSRVNTSDDEHEQIDLNELLQNILVTYNQRIQDSKATIHVNALPTITGSKTELIQLFQNLIGNALKYRSTEPPVINVQADDAEEFWQFSVTDNGIGIDARFYKKIFVIFQRLHHKNEYSGTGIGLAICKKIIERHGGKIWVESTPGKGSTFYFTMPK